MFSKFAVFSRTFWERVLREGSERGFWERVLRERAFSLGTLALNDLPNAILLLIYRYPTHFPICHSFPVCVFGHIECRVDILRETSNRGFCEILGARVRVVGSLRRTQDTRHRWRGHRTLSHKDTGHSHKDTGHSRIRIQDTLTQGHRTLTQGHKDTLSQGHRILSHKDTGYSLTRTQDTLSQGHRTLSRKGTGHTRTRTQHKPIVKGTGHSLKCTG